MRKPARLGRPPREAGRWEVACPAPPTELLEPRPLIGPLCVFSSSKKIKGSFVTIDHLIRSACVSSSYGAGLHCVYPTLLIK